jgi:hypothetical protein
MVDVCFEDSGLVERRPEGQLLTLNPAAKRAVAPSGRGKATPAPAADIYDPAEEQRRAVVRGIYESLVAKRLGMPLAQYKALRDMGLHPDLAAAERGTITQREFRAFVDKAQRLSIGVGRKQGYVSHTGKQPTPAGAAIAYARYGADPAVVQRLAKGHARALELAKEKNAAALAKNRDLYEIMLMLARKEQAPRVVEEIVGGKLVSFQQPGGKVTRRTNGRSWEERGMAPGAFEFPARMRPLLEEARKLGMEKGQALRQLAQVHKESAKEPLFDLLANIEIAFRGVSARALDLLGLDALDDAGLPTAETRRALTFLRKTYEDIASEVQRGRPIRNPIKQRTRHITRVYVEDQRAPGGKYAWRDAKTSRRETTDIVLYATSPAKDPQGVGFFSITFPPGRRDVVRALQEARGWEFDPTVSGTKFETGIATEAPKIHKVLPFRGGGAGAKRGVGGQFGKGLYTVGGPRVPKKKDPPLFERKADAEEYARVLDLKAVSFLVPQTHEIVQLSNGYYEVRGPMAEGEIARRVERNKARDERGARPSEYENEDLLFETEGEAQKMAESLDYREARSGVLPIAGYRTKRGLTGEKAIEAYRNALVRLDENKVFYELHASAKAMEKPTASVKRHTWELGTKEEQAAAKKKRAAEVQDRINVLVREQGLTFGDAVVRAEQEIPQYRGKFVVRPDATTSARQKRLAERSPERLVSTAVARGEDVDVLIPLVAEAEERGRKKLVNLIAKSYEDEATKNATKAAAKELGAVGVAKVLSAPRDETSMKARMPGGFVQSARMFGAQRRVGFKKQASDLDVLLAALYPKGDVPPTLLPKYDRDYLRDLDEEALTKLAKSRLGLSDADIRKVLTSVERSVLSKIVAEQAPASGVELIERGGFNVEVPKAERRKAEAIERARRPAPKPMRQEAPREAAQKASVEERKAQIRAQMAEIKANEAAREAQAKAAREEQDRKAARKKQARKKQARKANGALSTGLRVAKSGGALAYRYGKQAYSAARTWVLSPAGQRFVGEVASIAVALFGARAVSSGKLTREQATLVQRELERTTGRTADPARVAVALQIAGE